MASSLLTSTPDLLARGSRASFADPQGFGLGEAAQRRQREYACQHLRIPNQLSS